MRYRLCIIFFFLYPAAITAVPVHELYSVRLSVADQGPESRNAGIREALRIVLVRLTGKEKILGRPEITALIDDAARYVLQYHYQQISVATSAATELSVFFDEHALNRILKEQGVTLWGQERPLVLVWLATEDQQGRRMVGRDTAERHLDIIDRYAERRGIAVLHPLLDLEDKAQLTASDIWAEFHAPIKKASRRYPANVILYGYIKQSAVARWQIHWTALIKERSSDWFTQAEILTEALRRGMDILTDKLLDYYTAVPLSQASTVTIKVKNITDLAQYAQVLRYLQSLNSVEYALVSSVAGDRVHFQLRSTADYAAISRTIALGTLLRPAASGAQAEFQLIK